MKSANTGVIKQAVLRAFLTTFVAVLFGLAGGHLLKSAGHHGAQTPVDRFFQWDAKWYLNIAQKGYFHINTPTQRVFDHRIEEFPTNVSFFPVFPISGRLLSQTLSISPQLSLLLVAWISAWGFLSFWLLLAQPKSRPLSQFPESKDFRYWLMLTYPVTFYLFVPYTESVFCLGAFGYFYFSKRVLQDGLAPRQTRRHLRAQVGDLVLGAAFGALMSGTRLVAVPFLLFPGFAHLLMWARQKLNSNHTLMGAKSFWKAVALMAGGSSGFFGFLVYCHYRFGDALVYFKNVPFFWGGDTPRTSLLKPSAWFHWLNHGGFPDTLSTLFTGAGILTIFVLSFRLLRRGPKFLKSQVRGFTDQHVWAVSFGLVVASAFLFLVWARTPFDFVGMLRYLIPLWATLQLGLVHWDEAQTRVQPVARVSAGWIAVGVIVGAHFYIRFLLGIAVS